MCLKGMELDILAVIVLGLELGIAAICFSGKELSNLANIFKEDFTINGYEGETR